MRAVAMLAGLLAVACASDPTATSVAPSSIRIRDCAGNTFDVPTEGMRRSEEGMAVARELQQLGDLVTKWRASRALPPDVATSSEAVVCQLLEASVADLQQAYRIASVTSAPLDTKLLSSATSIGRSARNVVNSGNEPYVDRVTTHVTSSVTPPYDVFYLPFRKYRNKIWEWSSHNPGEKLDIGAYYFRVRAGSKEFDELVVVFHEPTTRVLHGNP